MVPVRPELVAGVKFTGATSQAGVRAACCRSTEPSAATGSITAFAKSGGPSGSRYTDQTSPVMCGGASLDSHQSEEQDRQNVGDLGLLKLVADDDLADGVNSMDHTRLARARQTVQPA